MKRTLGVCYYPEHWPRDQWETDAAEMVAAGLSWVRIGEFAWSRMEAVPGTLTWDWLDDAIEVLGAVGLKVILGTPTATPPRWMIDKHPDMLAVDATNNKTPGSSVNATEDFSAPTPRSFRDRVKGYILLVQQLIFLIGCSISTRASILDASAQRR